MRGVRGFSAVVSVLVVMLAGVLAPAVPLVPAYAADGSAGSRADAVAQWAAVQPWLSRKPTWTGDVASCAAGDVNADFTAGTLAVVNYARRLAGVPPVAWDPNSAIQQSAQQAALMIAAGSGTHFPETTARCYTSLGAQGLGESNISGGTGAQAIMGQLTDGVAGDRLETGHRQWLLYPALTTVGIGSTNVSTAVNVLGGPLGPGLDRFVSWPSAGYFPRQLEPSGLWSVARDGADFSGATVTAVADGVSIPVRMVQPDTTRRGSPSVAWLMDLPNTHDDQSVTVTVAGIRLADGTTNTHTFTTVLFDAARETLPGGATHTISITCRSDTPPVGVMTHVATSPGDVLVIRTANCRYMYAVNGADPVGSGFTRDTAITYSVTEGATLRLFITAPVQRGDYLVQLQVQREQVDGQGFALVVQGKPTSNATTGREFASCTRLHRAFPHGVAVSRLAQRRVVRAGAFAAAVHPIVYAASRRLLDPDGDGVLCPVRRPGHA